MGSLPGVHFLILDLKTDNVKEFQCNSRYNVVHKVFYHYQSVENGIFLVVTLSVNNMKTRLLQNNVLCRELIRSHSFSCHKIDI